MTKNRSPKNSELFNKCRLVKQWSTGSKGYEQTSLVTAGYTFKGCKIMKLRESVGRCLWGQWQEQRLTQVKQYF
ncbi:hypothetical protein FGO68_gene16912 [Halteria grandinella]|uniref:Uncharacterized protein n=1 Tax=Halteria grandinella TaxID=5974 RepID=A0A8J8T086_HALGN|nr:hypothetical protein FGO68_gene16912 [Halteria grandinella]